MFGKFSDHRVSFTTGVVKPPARSAPGHRRDDADLGAVGRGAAEALEEPHVVVADIDVHEAPDLARVVEDPRLDPAVVGLEVVEHLPERVSLRGHLGRTAGVVAQDGRDPDADAHGCCLLGWVAVSLEPARAQTMPLLVNAAYDGSMVAAGPTVPETESRVFKP